MFFLPPSVILKWLETEEETEICMNKHTFRITSSANGEALQYLVRFQPNSFINTVFVFRFFKFDKFDVSINFNKKASDTINKS